MFIIELIGWWYRRGWAGLITRARHRTDYVLHLFSVPVLIRTLFAPWRRIITYPGSSLEARFRALGDNLVSRLVGLTVRTFVLLTAAIMLTGSVLLAAVQLVVWPLLPPLALAFIVKGIIG